MVQLSERAAQKVKTLTEEQGKTGHGLRIKVVGGGCSGYSYQMDFELKAQTNDKLFDSHGIKIFVDPKSLELVNNSVIDWSDALTGAGFTVTNPNASGTCGCGTSFTV